MTRVLDFVLLALLLFWVFMVPFIQPKIQDYRVERVVPCRGCAPHFRVKGDVYARRDITLLVTADSLVAVALCEQLQDGR